MAQRPISLNSRPIIPREAYGLAGGFLLASAAHLSRLPLWLGTLIVIIVFWRIYLARRSLPSPGKWLLGLLAFAAAAGILIEYRTLLGRDAGVALLVVMLALKVLETRTLRDGSKAQCGRRHVDGEHCAQHAKMAQAPVEVVVTECGSWTRWRRCS